MNNPGLLPFAVLSNTSSKNNQLQSVASLIDSIADRRTQSNVMASAAILAGLVLEEEVIQRLLRRDIMRESVIYQSIMVEGRQEGRQEGKEETAREIAVNLLKEGLSLELVVKATGLTIDVVQQLQTAQSENQKE
ncbi:MAG: hypothetical protein KME64_15570 [Scytonematopsis contorta HA4267-MV1]|jgi:predicted transposase/invertase (TIGR01784 family)|nr:hypothetical protein [Scytonematopsis contorta HA4267-MV1]